MITCCISSLFDIGLVLHPASRMRFFENQGWEEAMTARETFLTAVRVSNNNQKISDYFPDAELP